MEWIEPDHVPFGIYRHRYYCTACGKWKNILHHKGCEQSPAGVIVFDLSDTFSPYWPEPVVNAKDRALIPSCYSCHQQWEIDRKVYYCDCGHDQQVEYCTEFTGLCSADRVLAVYGEIIEYETEDGVFVIARQKV